MKLHRLRLAAIGPFASEIDIDLAKVSSGGLFLLEGPTGSGKSTILDAITFALYGGVAGKSTSKDRLHSDFSDAEEPFAELDFSVGGTRYRIRRTPTFERVKRDGSGTTTVNSKVWLWRIEAEANSELTEDLMSNRVREADDEIRRLLGGLSLEQFCQVVILPQGEFATFLRADAEQRRDVLQRLFATDHYQTMERVAADLRLQAQREVGEVQQRLRDAVVALRQVVGEQAADDEPLSVDDMLALSQEELAAHIDRVAERAKGRRETASTSDHEASRALDVARLEHDAIAVRLEQIELRRGLEVEREQLSLLAPEISTLIEERDRAVRVQALMPMFDELSRLQAELSSLASLNDQQRQHFTALDPKYATYDDGPEDIREVAKGLRDQLAQLGPAQAVEDSLPAQVDAVRLLVDANTQHQHEREMFAERVRVLPARLAELVEGRDALQALTARAPDLRRNLVDAHKRAESWQRIAGLDADVLQLKDDLRAVVDDAQQARDSLQQATELRLAGMAAELASNLEAGVACVVCGSTEHPHPASNTTEQVSEEQLRDLAQADEVAQRRRHEVQELLAAKVAERERCRAQAGDVDPHADVLRLEDEVRSADEAQEKLPELEAQCTRCQIELDGARAGLTTAELNLSAGDVRLRELNEQVEAGNTLIATARAEFLSVRHRAQALEEQAEFAEQWAQGMAELQVLSQQRDAVSDAVDTSARDAGCADAADAMAAVRGQDELQVLADRIAQFERQKAVNASAILELQHIDLTADVPDISVAATHLSAAGRTADEARAALTAHEITFNEVTRCAARIATAQASITQAQSSTSATIRVADALSGQGRVNHRRMTLSTYVLRERFASVVDAASRRLDRMSDGRYVLERDEALAGNKKAGLGLVVLDQWNGARRDTRTLSGGESFYASLSLALGLADVVRDEAGGVELETLFIDEGFGSLDPESLESVLGVIDSLRDGGRVVGIVSHVSELKERIPDRIEVRRRPDGSSTVSIRAT